MDIPPKNKGIQAVVGITAILSILGSLLIIVTYIIYRDLRTRARLILLHLSVADLCVALANFIGNVANFESYYHNGSSLEPPPGAIDKACKIQAFFAHFFTLSSVMWTLNLAMYMYLLVTYAKKTRLFNYYMLFSCLICYGLSFGISLWMMLTDRLGYSPLDASGWCSLKGHKNSHWKRVDFISTIFGYDLWIILTCIMVAVLCMAIRLHIRQEANRIDHSSGSSAALFWKSMHSIDYKFILIPIMFILLRFWSLLIDVLSISTNRDIPKWVHITLEYLSGIGDTAQGAANAVLFVAFTSNVRQRLLSCHSCRKLNTRNTNDHSNNKPHETGALIEKSQEGNGGMRGVRYHDSGYSNNSTNAILIKSEKSLDDGEVTTPVSMSYTPISDC